MASNTELTFITNYVFDHGAVEKLPKSLARLRMARPLLVTDKGLRAAGLVDRLLGIMGAEAVVYDGTPENPTEAAVNEALALYREADCDGIVALGGGSPMDLAKGLAVLAVNPGPLSSYALTTPRPRRIEAVVPLIAIPTTAGTGSETSSSAVVIMDNGVKAIFSARVLIPRVAICDPDLTRGLPKYLTAATGMDAMTHCIEAVIAPAINPPAEAVGLDGIRRGIREGFLEKAVADGDDKEARWNMMMASTEGAMAFTKGLGAVHSLSHAAGAIPGLHLHHGTLNAVFLPAVLRFNADYAARNLARVGDAMGLPAGADVADAIVEINGRLGLPAGLAAMGVTQEHVAGMVAHAIKDPCNLTNPRPVTESDLEALIEASW